MTDRTLMKNVNYCSTIFPIFLSKYILSKHIDYKMIVNLTFYKLKNTSNSIVELFYY